MEDSIHEVVMFLSNGIGLGMGLSIIVFSLAIRLIFYPLSKMNVISFSFRLKNLK